MNSNGGNAENLLRQFPLALQPDSDMLVLAKVIAQALAMRWDEAALGTLYPRIDELPEAVLDILAYDFKVDWWDRGYSVEEKRRTLKDAWKVHRMKGTKAAVEMAISAIYPHTRVLEWFEYGAPPYHFRLDINITDDTMDSEKQRRVLERLKYYKNLRSHNDGVTYFVEAAPAPVNALGGAPGLWEAAHIPLELPTPIIKRPASARAGVLTGVWEAFGAGAALQAPDIRSPARARTGAITALREAFDAKAALEAPAIRSRAAARLGAITAREEQFMARAALTPIPPRSGAALRAAAAGAVEERYTTAEIPLLNTVLIAAATARSDSAVASTQETVETKINF